MRVVGLGVCAFAAALAGCASAVFSPYDSTVSFFDRAPTLGGAAATPACAGSRIGRAQCDVVIEPDGVRPTYSGWSARSLELAYDLPSLTKGRGQIVAVVDAYDNPDVETDFAAYRKGMGLPPGRLDKYNQEGQMANYPEGSPDWGVEIDLDVEMVSASCPKCTVYLVEADSNQWSDIEAAVKEAVKLGATIVSNSYDGTGARKRYYDTKGVEYLASADDSGSGLYPPAAFDSVVAVGGTFLNDAGNKRGYKDEIWPDTGGGCAVEVKKPKWQLYSKYAKSCAGRMGNDVSAVAVDVAEYDSYDEGGWITVDGTSISAPFVAGIFGLAGNSREQDGGRTFWLPKSQHEHLYKIEGERFTDQGGWGTPHGIGAF